MVIPKYRYAVLVWVYHVVASVFENECFFLVRSVSRRFTQSSLINVDFYAFQKAKWNEVQHNAKETCKRTHSTHDDDVSCHNGHT